MHLERPFGGRPEVVPPVRSTVMRRILVGGVSAAGKTTLARELARRLDLPYIELDALFHGPGWQPRPEFIDDVARFAATDAWVTDSHGYRSVRDLLWSRADTVIWLDYPRRVVMSRVVRRTAVRRWRREPLFNGNLEPPMWTIFTDREYIVRWAWSSFASRRADMERRQAAREYRHLTIVRLRHPRETARWLATLDAARRGDRSGTE